MDRKIEYLKLSSVPINKLLDKKLVVGATGITLTIFDGNETPYYESWFKNPEVTQFLRVPPVQGFMLHSTSNPLKQYYRINHPIFGFIGHLGTSSQEDDISSCEVSIVMGVTEAWGKGIATQVLNSIINNLKNLGCRKIILTSHPDNLATRKIAEKFNFKETDSLTTEELVFQLKLQ